MRELHRVRGISLPEHAVKAHLAAYVYHLAHENYLPPVSECRQSDRRRRRLGIRPLCLSQNSALESKRDFTSAGEPSPQMRTLADGTKRLYLTAVRLYYAYLTQTHICLDNPFTGQGATLRAWLCGEANGERYATQCEVHCSCGLPRNRQRWCPSHEEWHAVLTVLHDEPLRNQAMFRLVSEAGLRSAELCRLRIGDIDLTRRLVTIAPVVSVAYPPGSVTHDNPAHRDNRWASVRQPKKTKRTLVISAQTAELCGRYIASLQCAGQNWRKTEPLFRSESLRNRAQPVLPTTWSKVIRRLSTRSGVDQLSLPALHHLCTVCIDSLARGELDLLHIAAKNVDL
jgi:integrase